MRPQSTKTVLSLSGSLSTPVRSVTRSKSTGRRQCQPGQPATWGSVVRWHTNIWMTIHGRGGHHSISLTLTDDDD
jgi:hypothetical protein